MCVQIALTIIAMLTYLRGEGGAGDEDRWRATSTSPPSPRANQSIPM